jgi:hypothetical protein
MEFIKDGSLVVNVYHVTTSQPITTVNLTALADVFRTWWTTAGKLNSVTALALSRVVVTDISVPNGLQVVSAPALPEAGTVAGTDTPSNVALAISWRTGFSGRSYRGRTYFAGLLAADVQSNFVTATRQSALLTTFGVLRTNLISAGYPLVVASFYANGAPRAAGVATPINSIIVNNRVDTQRRRLPGSGA